MDHALPYTVNADEARVLSEHFEFKEEDVGMRKRAVFNSPQERDLAVLQLERYRSLRQSIAPESPPEPSSGARRTNGRHGV